MKKKLLALIAKLEARMATLGAKAEASEDVTELRGINTEIGGVTADLAECRSMLADIEAKEAETPAAADPAADERAAGEPAAGDPAAAPEERQVMGSYGMAEMDKREAAEVKVLEQRGADLKDRKSITVEMDERATTVASSNLLVQKKYSNTLNETFNEVSSLIDRVNGVPLIGGESYSQSFEVSFDEADYSTEAGAYNDGDPVTDYVEIGKAKITAYSEITDEAQKLPNVNYQALVIKNVRIAIRKKITKQLLIGAGTANTITGIFNAPVNVIPLASDLDVSVIDADTLDDIVLGYGGDEDVEGGAVLIINKKTLKNFAAVRSTDGKKLYKITINADGNTGTISSEDSWNVPYILNSAVAGFDTVVEDDYFGAYGKLQAYEMPTFSALTIEESKDFKFSTGQIAYRGAVWIGGNVASYKGFMRLKKVAVA